MTCSFIGILSLGLLTAALGACATSPINAETGFVHADYAYSVPPHASGKLMGPDWLLDNYYGDPARLKPKKTDEYMTTYAFDVNGNGEADRVREEMVFDLRFEHRRTAATIWLRTVPLSQTHRETELRVLAQAYVEALAGAGYEAVNLNSGHTIVRERRFASTVVSEGAITLAGREAYAMVLDVANVDQLKLNPKSRSRRVKLVLIRTAFSYEIKRVTGFPVLMVAGYANQPADFDRNRSDFDELLQRITIDGVAGYALPPGTNPNQSPPTHPTPPQEPVQSAAPAPAPTPPPPAPSTATPAPAATSAAPPQ